MSTRNISFSLIWTLIILVSMDLYVYLGLRRAITRHKWNKILQILYFIAIGFSYIGFYYLYSSFLNKPLQVGSMSNLFIGFFFAFFVFKALMILFFLSEDLFRLAKLIYELIKRLINGEKHTVKAPGRRNFIRQTGLIIAGIPFTSMLYGITKGKYNFKVNKVKLSFKNLPKSFEGFKIVQISDIHAGSFDDKEAILNGINLVNEQAADVILFTGDLVNNDSREIEPYLNDFKKLKAQEGVYAVLGNHDYGDYKSWDSVEDKVHNMELLYDFHERMGFKLLNNQNASIVRDNDAIGIYGVENWGNPPFPQKGDLDKALEGNSDSKFKVLMSHDPTHWNKKVVNHTTHFDLTLSGHTHGMQFGVEIPGFKWSPIKYIYPQWAGLYERAEQLLYVNRGFGFLGFPGRVGIWPEITVIELVQKA